MYDLSDNVEFYCLKAREKLDEVENSDLDNLYTVGLHIEVYKIL